MAGGTLHDERSGLLFALAGFAMLSVGDAVVKSMAGQWAPTAIATLRYVFGAVGLSALLFAREGVEGFRFVRPGVQIVRGVSVAVATVTFFSALLLMPLAEATTIVFMSPLITALLAPMVLREPARAATWAASGAAFIGVLLVLRPNLAELGLAALLPLGAAFAMSALFMANRSIAGTASALSMQGSLALIAAPVLVMATLIGHASGQPALHVGVPSLTVIGKCLFVAFSASSAHWLIYLGTTRAGAATVAPMTYVQLVVAATLGWLWFGDRPDLTTLAGAAIIIGAGLYLWRSGRSGSERRP